MRDGLRFCSVAAERERCCHFRSALASQKGQMGEDSRNITVERESYSDHMLRLPKSSHSHAARLFGGLELWARMKRAGSSAELVCLQTHTLKRLSAFAIKQTHRIACSYCSLDIQTSLHSFERYAIVFSSNTRALLHISVAGVLGRRRRIPIQLGKPAHSIRAAVWNLHSHGLCMLTLIHTNCTEHCRTYQDGAPGPTTPHLQEHAFLLSHQAQHGDLEAAFRDREHRAEEEQPELQPGD